MKKAATSVLVLTLFIVPILAISLTARAAAAPAPSVIGIDLVGRGTPMGSAESAGVVARARWNTASGQNRTTPLGLVDETGAPTGATVTWRSDGVWSMSIADIAGNSRLMKGYLDARGVQSTRITVSGLAAGGYDVYVYADGDNRAASRTGTYRISGLGITTQSVNLTDAANRNFSGTFTQANNSSGNYVRFSINATGFTLTVNPGSASDGIRRAPVNGIQIVPTSPPVTGTFSISGGITPAPAGGGALVKLGGAATASTTADASGHYSFTGLVNGSFAVMPARTGYVFTPSSRNVTIAGADLTGIDFSASPAPNTYTISGTISPASGGAGATVTMTGGASATTTADGSGSFAFNGVSSGTYTISPSKPGYAFAPASQSVAVESATVTAVNFTAFGPTKDRANSYDDAWEAAWVNHGRALLATSGKTGGFVLEIGDSITHSFAYAAWPLQGQGKTAEDAQVIAWARATTWGGSNVDVTHKNGWYLAGADTTTQRGMTSSGGLSTGELVSGCCNGGSVMPASTNPTTARQLIADPTYTGNIQIDTLISAFGDSQFAVVMLGTNDPGSPNALADLTAIVDKLEAARILPILSTIPPRNDAFPDQLNVQFNAAVTSLAQARSLPLIDFYREMLLRRPDTTWFNTLISSDGVHPTANGGGFTLASNPYVPGGDAATHTTGDALANVGYLLRSWLTVQKLKEVKSYVIDGVDPPSTPSSAESISYVLTFAPRRNPGL